MTMTDKYNIGFPQQVLEEDKMRLINQLWKLVPMRENDEDWQSHLKSIRAELIGLIEIYKGKTLSLILLSKLEGLTSEDCKDFMIYRKTIFKCIDLLSRMLSNDR